MTEEVKQEPSPETIAAVAERLNFFFSDANIRQDFFLRKYLMSDEKHVPIEALLSFNTIKQHTESIKTVVQATKEKLADKLVVSPDGTAIGLVEAFTQDKMDGNIPVSLHVSCLPVGDNNKYTISGNELRSMFGEGIALVKLLFHRHGKEHTKTPSGAALVEYQSVAQLQAAAAEYLTIRNGEAVQPKTPIKVGDKTVTVKLLKEYVDERKKRKSLGSHKEEKKAGENDDETEERTVREFKLDWKPGCVISVKGFAIDGCDREAILDSISKALNLSLEEIKSKNIYADYSRGQTDGAIRFAELDGNIQVLCDKLNKGEILVAGSKVESAALLEGEQEKEYWNKFIEFKNMQLKQRFEERSSRKHKKARRS